MSSNVGVICIVSPKLEPIANIIPAWFRFIEMTMSPVFAISSSSTDGKHDQGFGILANLSGSGHPGDNTRTHQKIAFNRPGPFGSLRGPFQLSLPIRDHHAVSIPFFPFIRIELFLIRRHVGHESFEKDVHEHLQGLIPLFSNALKVHFPIFCQEFTVIEQKNDWNRFRQL
jgi:hypothetical protein